MRARGTLTEAEIVALAPGDVVAVRIAGVWHEGIADEERDAQGRPFVWNSSKRTGRVERETWDRFGGGLRATRLGYFGKLPPSEVIANARARQGQPWTPIDNCQRFTRRCHGVRRAQPDAEAVGLAFLIALIAGGV